MKKLFKRSIEIINIALLSASVSISFIRCYNRISNTTIINNTTINNYNNK